MGSPSAIDFDMLSLVLQNEQDREREDEQEPEHEVKSKEHEFVPTPYTFTKLERGKKTIIDSSSITPPSWLLLDHTIAVVWLIFSSNAQLTIDDLKWAHEFLKEIRNSKGENPPDVKACLKEIQDRLINLYARLNEDGFDQMAGLSGEPFFDEPRMFSSLPRRVESRFDRMSLSSSFAPSRSMIRFDYPLYHRHSSKDITIQMSKQKRIGASQSKKEFPIVSKTLNIFEDSEMSDDEEIQKYILNVFEDDKKDDSLQGRSSVKSFIPMKRRNASALSLSEMKFRHDSTEDLQVGDKSPKKVHCVAEMKSLKFQKSMKVQDTNGEPAYSNLKAEIKRLVINPEVSKTEIRKFVKQWKMEETEKIRCDMKRLSSIEEIIKMIDEVQPNPENSTNP